ncbi:MAG: endonuclease/exonuclease/phosphatase family protein [Mucilaginibacter sp.]
MANFGFKPEIPLSPKPVTGNIRVMVYNVHNFMGLDTSHRSFIHDTVFKLIKDEQPDIVSLQEFSVNIESSKYIYAGAVKSMQSNQYYFKPYNLSEWDTIGVAILSKFPIINHGVISNSINQPKIEAIFVDVKTGPRVFRVYALHLKPTDLKEQDHNYIKKLTHRANVNVHELSTILRKLKIAFQKRADQVVLIKQHAGKCPYPYLITGDFNDTPISFAVNQISKGLKNAFIEKGAGSGITYFGDFPHFQIDYILASQQFKVVSYQTIRKKVSDHYPILSDLELMH